MARDGQTTHCCSSQPCRPSACVTALGAQQEEVNETVPFVLENWSRYANPPLLGIILQKTFARCARHRADRRLVRQARCSASPWHAGFLQPTPPRSASLPLTCQTVLHFGHFIRTGFVRPDSLQSVRATVGSLPYVRDNPTPARTSNKQLAVIRSSPPTVVLELPSVNMRQPGGGREVCYLRSPLQDTGRFRQCQCST